MILGELISIGYSVIHGRLTAKDKTYYQRFTSWVDKMLPNPWSSRNSTLVFFIFFILRMVLFYTIGLLGWLIEEPIRALLRASATPSNQLSHTDYLKTMLLWALAGLIVATVVSVAMSSNLMAAMLLVWHFYWPIVISYIVLNAYCYVENRHGGFIGRMWYGTKVVGRGLLRSMQWMVSKITGKTASRTAASANKDHIGPYDLPLWVWGAMGVMIAALLTPTLFAAPLAWPLLVGAAMPGSYALFDALRDMACAKTDEQPTFKLRWHFFAQLALACALLTPILTVSSALLLGPSFASTGFFAFSATVGGSLAGLPTLAVAGILVGTGLFALCSLAAGLIAWSTRWQAPRSENDIGSQCSVNNYQKDYPGTRAGLRFAGKALCVLAWVSAALLLSNLATPAALAVATPLMPYVPGLAAIDPMLITLSFLGTATVLGTVFTGLLAYALTGEDRAGRDDTLTIQPEKANLTVINGTDDTTKGKDPKAQAAKPATKSWSLWSGKQAQAHEASTNAKPSGDNTPSATGAQAAVDRPA